MEVQGTVEAVVAAETCQTCLNCDHYQGNGAGPCSYCGCFRQNHLQPGPTDAGSLDSRGIPRLDCVDCGVVSCPKFLAFEAGSGKNECKRCFHPAGRHRVKVTLEQLQTRPLAQPDGGTPTYTNANTFGSAQGSLQGIELTEALREELSDREEKTKQMIEAVRSIYNNINVTAVIYDTEKNSVTAKFPRYTAFWYCSINGPMLQLTFREEYEPGKRRTLVVKQAAENVLRANIALVNNASKIDARFLAHRPDGELGALLYYQVLLPMNVSSYTETVKAMLDAASKTGPIRDHLISIAQNKPPNDMEATTKTSLELIDQLIIPASVLTPPTPSETPIAALPAGDTDTSPKAPTNLPILTDCIWCGEVVTLDKKSRHLETECLRKASADRSFEEFQKLIAGNYQPLVDWRSYAPRRITARITRLSAENLEELKSKLQELASANFDITQVSSVYYDVAGHSLLFAANGGWLCRAVISDSTQTRPPEDTQVTAEPSTKKPEPAELDAGDECWTLCGFNVNSTLGGFEYYELEGEKQILDTLQGFSKAAQQAASLWQLELLPIAMVISTKMMCTIPVTAGNKASGDAVQAVSSVDVCIEHSLISQGQYGTIVTVSATDSKVLKMSLKQLGLQQQAKQALDNRVRNPAEEACHLVAVSNTARGKEPKPAYPGDDPYDNNYHHNQSTPPADWIPVALTTELLSIPEESGSAEQGKG
eukprot:TRINITY_DN2004_c1_g3_i1.p1 TRINITY_DN2004_c1_g3~~TRINITY_DN2004_c1_g3_i1.p1  ORF type:complete len:709 (-),score=87.33 TRINITY_DN2004_c1_g3_i1:47-2173(-)